MNGGPTSIRDLAALLRALTAGRPGVPVWHVWPTPPAPPKKPMPAWKIILIVWAAVNIGLCLLGVIGAAIDGG